MDLNFVKQEEQHQPVGSSTCTGFTTNATSEVSSPLIWGNQTEGCPPDTHKTQVKEKKKENNHWYVLRAAYGSEMRTYDFILANSESKDMELFLPKQFVRRTINGRVIDKVETLIPNILFVKASKKILDKFVFDNVHLPHLRYYYRQYHKDDMLVHEPLFVPDLQMKSFMQIYESPEKDKYITNDII